MLPLHSAHRKDTGSGLCLIGPRISLSTRLIVASSRQIAIIKAVNSNDKGTARNTDKVLLSSKNLFCQCQKNPRINGFATKIVIVLAAIRLNKVTGFDFG